MGDRRLPDIAETARDVAAWRVLARQVLPADVWAYLEAGADDEISLRDAAASWQRIALLPHVLRGVTQVDTRLSLLGMPLSMPILTTPNGRATRYHADGEAAVLEGAKAAGTLSILPSSVAPNAAHLAAHCPGARWWQQLYMYRDRGEMADQVAALREAGCGALVLTADLLPDGRPAPSPPPPATWEKAAAPIPASAFSGAGMDDLAWLCRTAGDIPVLVKGVLRADDAHAIADNGAAGVIVSNHGGNQLDTAVASADALGPVVDACGDRAVVLVDGGIRRGTSVAKALALGAKAVLVGRPISYGLAAGGAEGVRAVLEALHSELARTMALCGAPDISALDRSLVGWSRSVQD